MKVSELEGALLDYWVARAAGFAYTSAREAAFALDGQTNPCIFKTSRGDLRLAKADSVTAWNPSTDWSCGGPIIERERIDAHPRSDQYDSRVNCHMPDWGAVGENGDWERMQRGPTPLVAAMRHFVARKFGEEVEDTDALR